MKKSLTIFSILILVLLPKYISFAHAYVTNSNPQANSTISELPDRVWIEFDGNLSTFEGFEVNKLSVLDSAGNRLDDGKVTVGGARLSVGIAKQGSGKIVLKYRVVSEDGHPVQGELVFNSNAKVVNDAKVLQSQKTQTKSASKTPVSSSNSNSPKAELRTKIKNSPEIHESILKEHFWHIVQFLTAGIMIFIWSRIKRNRVN